MEVIEKIIVHTPTRKEVCTIESAEIIQKQRDDLFLTLQDIYLSRRELDKLNCKIMRSKEVLSRVSNES